MLQRYGSLRVDGRAAMSVVAMQGPVDMSGRVGDGSARGKRGPVAAVLRILGQAFAHEHGQAGESQAADAQQAGRGRARSLRMFKPATYSVMHLIVAVAVAYALTRDWRIALGVGIVEPLVQTVAYTLHEHVWSKVKD